MNSPAFVPVTFGRETCDAGDLARHWHASGYMTLVLDGGYAEAGDAGRFRVHAGDVLIHRPFEAHRDTFAGQAPHVLNLPLPNGLPNASLVRVADADAIVRLAEHDPFAAAELVAKDAEAVSGEDDWPDSLAAALRRPDPVRIGDWARANGLAPATVSRGFAQVFGTTAARYRAEARARLAFQAVSVTSEPLIELAYALGFADQAHMTRSVRALTGFPASRWRRQVKPIQDQVSLAT